MWVRTPTDDNPLYQEYMFHRWMYDADGYSLERVQALDSLRRIIDSQYAGQGCVMGRLISEYDYMVTDMLWEEDGGEAMAKILGEREYGETDQWRFADLFAVDAVATPDFLTAMTRSK